MHIIPRSPSVSKTLSYRCQLSKQLGDSYREKISSGKERFLHRRWRPSLKQICPRILGQGGLPACALLPESADQFGKPTIQHSHRRQSTQPLCPFETRLLLVAGQPSMI